MAPPANDFAVTMERRFDAAPDRVWAAWTDPNEVKTWWGGGVHPAESVDMDVRVGGAFRFVIKGSEGGRYAVGGTYLEVAAPRRLVHTWIWEGGDWDGIVMRVTVELEDDAGGTLMRLTHENLPDEATRDLHVGGWTVQFDSIEAYLKEA